MFADSSNRSEKVEKPFGLRNTLARFQEMCSFSFSANVRKNRFILQSILLRPLCCKVRRNDGPLTTFSRAAVEAAQRIGQNERTIRRWIETGKLPATKLGSQFKIALADLEPFLDKRPPDTKELLARIIALEDVEDVQASQASRLTDLERQVFLLQAKPHL
jgi:excisionase family DNA binding protein